MQTRTDADLARSEEALRNQDPERAEAIARVRRFKAGWYELASTLTSLRKSEQWKRWGHSTFEDYYRRELHLRRETVEKLTGSFAFLQKRAPQVLDRDGREGPLPSYQAVDFLRRAEEESGAGDDTLNELRGKVLDEAMPLSQLARRYNEVLFPLNPEAQGEKRRHSLRSTAARLIELLAQAREDGAVAAELAAEIEEPLQRLVSKLELN